MVAPLPEDPRFSPADRPRIAVAADGTLAAVAEPTRVTVVELPSGAPFAEIGLDPDALANELVWVGAPPRLLVLSRYAAHSAVHLLEPYGPRPVAEIQLEAPMKLYAAVGAHALAIGSPGAAVLTASESHLTPYQFPARVVPATVGVAAGNFVVALPGAIEEWDPHSRMPRRRLRLQRPSVITALGGSERVVWMTTQDDPARLDVIPLVNRGQPKRHELPEPIAHATGHPRSDLVVCVGADTGRVYVVDLDGETRLRSLMPGGLERTAAAALVVGRMVGVIAAQAQRPISIVSLERSTHEAELPARGGPEVPLARPTLLGGDVVSAMAAPVAPSEAIAPPSAPAPAPAAPPPAAAAQKAVLDLGARSGAAAARAVDPVAPPGGTPSWRDDVVAWARAIAAGALARPPAAAPIEALADRFELSSALVPALVLLYGAHLGGERGAAPVDLARVLEHHWDEALGTGQLASRGLAIYADSRVRLAQPVQRALDELPATTGVVTGEPGLTALLGPCVVIAGDDESLVHIAERHGPRVGSPILVAHAGVDPGALDFEARARGAVPMVRLPPGGRAEHGAHPVIFVVSDEASADALGLPRL